HMPKQHRRAVMGFEPHAWHPVLDREGHRHKRTRPELPMSPARGERIEGEGCPKSITVTTGPPSGFKTSPRPPKKCQPIRPAAAMIATPPNKMYRARKVIVAFIPVPSPYRAT